MRAFAKNALRSLLFVLILLLLLAFFSRLFLPKGNAREDGMDNPTANGFLAERENSLDVVFLGDSVAYHAIIPPEIFAANGITSYVCSSPNQKLCDSYAFLEKVFERQSPKLVVLETDEIYRTVTDEDVISFTAQRLLPVFRYHDRWKTLQKQDFSFRVSYESLQTAKGYVLYRKTDPAEKTDYMQKTEKRANIKSNNLFYLEKIRALCEKKGAELMLLGVPSAVNWNYRKHNAVSDYAKDKNLTFLDLNLAETGVNIDWKKDTRDKGDHLNYKGAKKVTAFLGTYLAERGLFTDKREHPDYEDWRIAVRDFREMAG